MTSKEYLIQFSNFKAQVHEKLDHIEIVKSKATKVTTSINELGTSRVGKIDNMENSIIEFIELEEDVIKDLDKLVELENIIQRAVDGLPDRKCRIIIQLRYIVLNEWDVIQIKTGYSYKQCKRLEQQALKEIILTSECP